MVMLSIWWDQLGVVYYELFKPTETITGDRYRTQLMRLSRALKDKRQQYNERYDKVTLQHDNARPHVAKVVKTYLETLKWEVLPTRCILQALLPRIITCFDQWHTTWLTNPSSLMKK
ncbi:mariner Mos1 transposase [Trichonephila clavipes]|nr:mariner Mos1 transposase [Trichonephila clavipes]